MLLADEDSATSFSAFCGETSPKFFDIAL